MSEKIPAIVVKSKREQLNLTIKDCCRIFRLEENTWKKWEEKDIAPYFFSFALKYLEENIESLRPKKKVSAGSATKKPFGTSFRQKFLAKTQKVENSDCRIWISGANSIRDTENGVFCSPKQAAWKIQFGEKPDGELKTTCGNEKCVNFEHLAISSKRSSGRKFISPDVKNLIRFELSKPNANQQTIAKTYRISVGTVSRIANENK